MTTTLGEAVVKITTDLSSLKMGLDNAKAMTAQAATQMQQRIGSQFKTASFSDDQVEQIKRQFETRAELEDDLYRATHTAKQNSLKDNADYYNNLRSIYAKNESMLTQITQTENAKRAKIEEQYAGLSAKYLIQAFAGKAAAIAMTAMVINKSNTSMTEAVKIYNTTNKSISDEIALYGKLVPFIGDVVSGYANLAKEASGLNKQLEVQAKLLQKNFELNNIQAGTLSDINIGNASSSDAKLLKIEQEKNEKIAGVREKGGRKEVVDNTIKLIEKEYAILAQKAKDEETSRLKAIQDEAILKTSLIGKVELEKELIILKDQYIKKVKEINALEIGDPTQRQKALDAVQKEYDKSVSASKKAEEDKQKDKTQKIKEESAKQLESTRKDFNDKIQKEKDFANRVKEDNKTQIQKVNDEISKIMESYDLDYLSDSDVVDAVFRLTDALNKPENKKPQVSQKEVGFSGFKEAWFSMTQKLLGGKDQYAKETAANTKRIADTISPGTVGN